MDFFINIIWNTIKDLNIEDTKISINDINLLFRTYPESINLYAQILQNLFDKYNKENISISYYISDILESDKAFVLQDISVVPAAAAKGDTPYTPRQVARTSMMGPRNPFIRSMGLIPIGEYT